MKFKKDVLMIDFETTNGKPSKAKPIQLAAVLLDKNTLEEKKEFSSYILQDMSDADPRSLQIHGITQAQLDGAPSPQEVMQNFLDLFGTNVYISCWTTLLDIKMIEILMASLGREVEEFDYHILDLWAIAYAHMVQQDMGEIRSSRAVFEYFGLPERGSHDALEDCRHAAATLRKIILG